MKTWHFLFVFSVVSLRAEAAAAAPRSSEACTSSESWNWEEWRGNTFTRNFEKGLLPRASAVKFFAQAWDFRKTANTDEEQLFADYWMARSLYQQELWDLAYRGFLSVTQRHQLKKSLGISEAALACLVEIHDRFPVYKLPPELVGKLASFPAGEVRDRAAAMSLLEDIGEGRSSQTLEARVRLLTEGSVWQLFSQTLLAVHRGDSGESVTLGRKLLSLPSWPSSLKRHLDPIRLIVARALYQQEEWRPSVEEFRKVSKSSNYLAMALSDMAWAQLKGRFYSETIGTVVSLQSGGMRRTFTPEAPMVMAMAFNEMCHYPESLQAIEYFRKSYSGAYDWLKKWRAQGNKSSEDTYAEAMRFLKKKSEVPQKIASEWIRSPHFIARQDLIQEGFLYEKRLREFEKQAVAEQREGARSLLEFLRELRPRYQKVKQDLPLGAPLPQVLAQDLRKLKEMALAYRALKRAARPWGLFAKNLDKNIPRIRQRMSSEIRRDIEDANLRMLMTLDEIAENMHFLEAEIFQGASQDIIWQNAHPDYKQLLLTFKKDSGIDPSKTWSWGSVEGGLEGTHEIWDDELGSFRADLYNNCSSKDKYMAVKRRVSSVEGAQ